MTRHGGERHITIEELLGRLEGVRAAGQGRWQARCPAHEDHRPSLSVAKGDKGIIIHCHAGCTPEAVCGALGISTASLFSDSGRVAEASDFGMREDGKRDACPTLYDYCDEAGRLLYQVVRYEPKGFSQRQPDGRGGWITNMQGVRRVLYRLPELAASQPDEPVFIVEGEKDVESLRQLGLVATTNPGGAGKWQGLCKDASFQKPLTSRRVAILGDNDEPGRRNVRMIAEHLANAAAQVRIVSLPEGFKDISDYIEARDSADSDDLRKLILGWYKKAPLWEAEPAGRLVFASLADVQSEPVRWFWPNRIPAGMFSMVAGNPNMGKSFLTMYLAAVASTGRDWPDCPNPMPAGTVLLVSGEESVRHAIKPRLEWNGADCSRIHILQHIAAGSAQQLFDIRRHVPELAAYLDSAPDCRAIFIDPITSYLGGANENSNSEIRSALLGLMSLAEERNVTIIGVSHLNKKCDLKAIHRTLGSVAFTAAARSLWLVETEPREQDSAGRDVPGPLWRKFLPVKANLSIEPSGLRFQVDRGRVIFDPTPCSQSADEAISSDGRMEARALDEAKAFLQEQLASGPRPAKEILDAAEAEGISVRTLRRAGKALEIDIRKSSRDGGWVWAVERAGLGN